MTPIERNFNVTKQKTLLINDQSPRGLVDVQPDPLEGGRRVEERGVSERVSVVDGLPRLVHVLHLGHRELRRQRRRHGLRGGGLLMGA